MLTLYKLQITTLADGPKVGMLAGQRNEMSSDVCVCVNVCIVCGIHREGGMKGKGNGRECLYFNLNMAGFILRRPLNLVVCQRNMALPIRFEAIIIFLFYFSFHFKGVREMVVHFPSALKASCSSYGCSKLFFSESGID